MSGKERLDIEMLSRKLVESRAQAKNLIEEGRVTVDGRVADKAGRIVCASSRISVSEPLRFVSRGGLKLLAAIEQFRVSFDNCSVLDVGASTGGFTDCVLQFGARHVTCVDVGRDQLHHRLRTDSRVVNLEGINARDLSVSLLPASEYDRIVIDLSFISITLILENVWPLLSGSGAMIALVKPQFEAGREAVSKGRGVIRDDETRHNIRRRIERFAWDALPGCSIPETIECPLPGSDGNREFLMLLQKQQHERQNMCQAPSDSARARSRGNE